SANSWTEKSVKMTLLHQLRVICGICVPDLRNLREIEAYPDLKTKQYRHSQFTVHYSPFTIHHCAKRLNCVN
ncbi:MAG: hypothetical protein WC252_06890, partial [Candidatus Cloacimonadaceae bacterium]